MKHYIIYLLLFLASTLSFADDNDQNVFTLGVEQNGKAIPVKNDEVTIKKGAFNLVFTSVEPMSILINASFNSTTYDAAKKKIAKDLLAGFQTTAMAEGLQNQEQDIMISNESPSYWFFTNNREHRFNNVVVKNGHKEFRRTIKSFYLVEEQKSLPATLVKHPLYIVVIYTVPAQDAESPIELYRRTLKINWE